MTDTSTKVRAFRPDPIQIEYEAILLQQLCKTMNNGSHEAYAELYLYMKERYNFFRRKGYTRKDISVIVITEDHKSGSYDIPYQSGNFGTIDIRVIVKTNHSEEYRYSQVYPIFSSRNSKKENGAMEMVHELIQKIINVDIVHKKLSEA